MLRGIKFNDDKYFESTDDNNLMDTLTQNTIILCEDTEIKKFLYNAIKDICYGKHEKQGYDYYIEKTDLLQFRYGINYLPTVELNIDDEQKIILTVEAPYILTATSPKDIWFAQRYEMSLSETRSAEIRSKRIFTEFETQRDKNVCCIGFTT